MRHSLFLLSFVVACGSSSPNTHEPRAGQGAEALLRAGNFEQARARLAQEIADEPRSARLRVMRAIVVYENAARHLASVVRDEPSRGLELFRSEKVRAAAGRVLSALQAVDHDLSVAATDRSFFVELCPACWHRDWDVDGDVDESDRRLFEIERGPEGILADDDPRRRPTFRFDYGDIFWARAMVAFQSAALNLALAYDVPEFEIGRLGQVRVPLRDGRRVTLARSAILRGLEHTDRARREYLAEVDDDREWLPNPSQVDHPVFMSADSKLYSTWANAVVGLRQLVMGQGTLSLATIGRLAGVDWQRDPNGGIDVGRMLSSPGDIVVDLTGLAGVRVTGSSDAAAGMLGRFHVVQVPTPLSPVLRRISDDVRNGRESLGEKLRYLVWIN
jgi:hypothetical protein